MWTFFSGNLSSLGVARSGIGECIDSCRVVIPVRVALQLCLLFSCFPVRVNTRQGEFSVFLKFYISPL